MSILSYHNNSELKSRFVAEVERHRVLDMIKQGTYGSEIQGTWRGCAVACSLRSLDKIDHAPQRPQYSDHGELASRLGIPLELAHLEDRIFEGLDAVDAMLWPTLFARAIQVGVDLSLVWPRFAHWMLIDPKNGVARLAAGDAKSAIETVAALFERIIAGAKVHQAEWHRAAGAAAVASKTNYQTMAEKLLQLLSAA